MQETIIKSQRFYFLNFKEIFDYRDTLFFLAWRDIKIKYKQAILGFLWVVLQPLLSTFIFVLLTTTTQIKFTNNVIPYPLFVLSGIVLWNLFSTAINQTSNSVVNNAHIIKKVYFPRIFFPLSSLLISSFDFFISLIIYFPLMIYYNIYPSICIIFIFPLTYILVSMLILGIGSFFAALNVKYRDVKYLVPFFTQIMFFLSPTFYSVDLIKITWIKNLYYINPMTGIIDLFRYSLFNTPFNTTGLLISVAICILSFLLGIFYFRFVEHNFADIA